MRCVTPWYNRTGWLGIKHLLTYQVQLHQLSYAMEVVFYCLVDFSTEAVILKQCNLTVVRLWVNFWLVETDMSSSCSGQSVLSFWHDEYDFFYESFIVGKTVEFPDLKMYNGR